MNLFKNNKNKTDNELDMKLEEFNKKTISEKIEIAKDPSTQPELLEIISQDPFVKLYVAGNISTPPEVLNMFVYGTLEEKKFLAGNTSTPPETLEKLALEGNTELEHWLARNTATPSHILTHLSQSPDAWTRVYVAGNEATPQITLIKLANDKNSSVISSLLQNPSTPPVALQTIAKSNDVLYSNRAKSRLILDMQKEHSEAESLIVEDHVLGEVINNQQTKETKNFDYGEL